MRRWDEKGTGKELGGGGNEERRRSGRDEMNRGDSQYVASRKVKVVIMMSMSPP